MATIGRLLSIQVALPRDHGRPDAADPEDRRFVTGIFKEPVSGSVRVGREGIAGDGQASVPVHGGPDRAVLGYAAAHYEAWRREFPQFAFPYGAFGENFTLAGMVEDSVCIGDTVAVGEALLQVSLPRGPCHKISRRCGIPDLLEHVKATRRIGWLYRVLREGAVQAGAPMTLAERPYPEWPVGLVYDLVTRVRAGDTAAIEAALAVAACEALGAAWRESIPRHCRQARASS